MFKKIILSFTSLVIIGLVPFALSNQANDPIINVAGAGTPIYSSVQVEIDRSDFGSTINTFLIKNADLYLYAEGSNNTFTQLFEYSASSKVTNNENSSPYFFLYTNSNTPFNSNNDLNASGSSTNKFRLTAIQIVVTKYNSSLGVETTIDLKNDFVSVANQRIGSFTSTTSQLTDESLDANQVTLSKSFLFSDNIQQFTILPSSPIVVSSMILTYSIDYSAC